MSIQSERSKEIMRTAQMRLAAASEQIKCKRNVKAELIRHMKNGVSLYSAINLVNIDPRWRDWHGGKLEMADICAWREADDTFHEDLQKAQQCFSDVSVDRMHDAALAVAQKAAEEGSVHASVVRSVDVYAKTVRWIAERTHRDKYQPVLDKVEDIETLIDYETVTTWV